MSATATPADVLEPVLIYGSAPKMALDSRQFPPIPSEWAGEHPCPKPLAPMSWLVESLTEGGEVVLDPFCGSGTTGVACLRLGRRFIGIEKDATYAAVARERLAAESQGLTLRDARAGQLSLLVGLP